MDSNTQLPSQHENAEALIIALRSRRFVIIRQDAPKRLLAANPICKRIRDLRPGDEVYYDGKPDQILSLAEY